MNELINSNDLTMSSLTKYQKNDRFYKGAIDSLKRTVKYPETQSLYTSAEHSIKMDVDNIEGIILELVAENRRITGLYAQSQIKTGEEQ